ncbi:MAG: (d)CMP kinase [Candidatus Marinimicrobia bacterium]|jgi:cytidylate kinase|nr:(d)CMP kinase [Candidatus Neomarinimicrobiota bacterium]MDD4962031.1 (d)CMP kinase [Candidatus Neomarinimicrobiota bacterium]MDD5709662.1 (d)CMP kinase [Candidatus Neomarinimicrobiota bacterium]MDX9777414.1 (d)CMP kinase [bacterium]
MIIAIDGPSGSGKSSTAKQVAIALGYVYLDTGAMYRAAAVGVLRSGIDPEDEIAVANAVRSMDIGFCGDKILLNGEDVSVEIRRDAANKAVTPVSANPAVRDLMVEKQRAFARNHNVVMEGRDIGTVVFPDADFKFFLTADLDVRARRRMREAPEKLGFEAVRADLQRRDERDSTRAHSPLRKAEDAREIDTGHLTFDEQVDKILSIIEEPKHGGK